jgi:uncharacterized protein (DUF1810 family)
MNRFREKLDDEKLQRILQHLYEPKKTQHWMWWAFPVDDLSCPEYASPTTVYYAMQGIEEAVEFMTDPVLGNYYRQALEIMVDKTKKEDLKIFFGPGDFGKFRSHLSFFHRALVLSRNSVEIDETILENIKFLMNKCDPLF